MSRLALSDTALAGVKLIDRSVHRDARGHFARLFCADDLAPAGWIGPVAQVNESYTARRGSVRGMHFQLAPHAEWKLVSCIRGEILDVALDVREGSPTLLRWHAERLSAANGRAFLIPPGFAHGFQALTDDVAMVYVHSHRYVAAAESGLNPTDPAIGIDWPLAIADMSERDRERAMVDDDFAGVAL